MSDTSDFYEEDEPAEKIREAFERGTKGRTGKRPRDLNQLAASIVEDATKVAMIRVPTDISRFRIEGVVVQGEPEALRRPVSVSSR